MSGKILFVSDDLLFWARFQALAKSSGRDARRIGDAAAMEGAFSEGGVARVIVDLGAKSVDALAWAARWKGVEPPPELIAYGAHVDETALFAARAAGFDQVMPNSRFHRSLAEFAS
jgi:DNA-binding response OmpR family regulator